MAQAQRLFLLHGNRVDQLSSTLDLGHLLVFAEGVEGLDEIGELIKVPHHFLLVRRGNHRKALGAHGRGLFRNEFNTRRIKDGEQLLRYGLGGGQEAGAHASSGDNDRSDPGVGILVCNSHKFHFTMCPSRSRAALRRPAMIDNHDDLPQGRLKILTPERSARAQRRATR